MVRVPDASTWKVIGLIPVRDSDFSMSHTCDKLNIPFFLLQCCCWLTINFFKHVEWADVTL